MGKKIDKEKSVVYSQWNDPVSLGTKGTFVNDFDKPEDYCEGTLWRIRADEENPFRNRCGRWYKYFVPRNTKVLVKEDYKPFYKLDQLRDTGLHTGDYFFIRSKDNKKSAHLVTITEVTVDYRGCITSIGLGVNMFTPEELFKDYEWIKDINVECDWNVFGIEE